MERSETPVLVVGGGPVGLLSGIALAQQGLACRVIERRAALRPMPAAHVVNARTLEICRATGVDMAAIARISKSPEDAGQVRFMTRLVGEELGSLPFERQGPECLDWTPTPLRNIAQHRFEPVLLDTIRRASLAQVDFQHELESCEADATGVTSRVRDRASDRSHEIRSRWLIAADGAGSGVRRSLGIGMDGPTRIQHFVMVHFAANLRPLVAERPGALFWVFSPECTGTFVAHDIDSEWVYMLPWNDDTLPVPSPEACAEQVYRAIGTREIPIEVLHVSQWTMTAQVAERMRAGRIFLAGDAAHRFPPTGGLGLNSGIQDAHNLAWKLRAVEDGLASEGWLDSYEAERRPVARNNAEQSLRNAMRIVEIPQALGLDEVADEAAMRARLADPERRRALETAIANQAEHFDMPGLQLGFVYEAGALVPDPKATPRAHDLVREYVPTSRPGARLPHAWVVARGERVSLLDLLDPAGFTLVTGADGVAFARAARAIEAPALRTLVPGVDFEDTEEHWQRVCEIEPGGAILVRPDQHVAWRCHGPSADPEGVLRAALAAILGRETS